MKNREIKFRLWRKDIKRFDYIDFNEFINIGDGFHILFPYEVLFQQFTGLTDKNGKEIYEGDIIKIPDNSYPNKYIVEYNNKVGAFTASGLPFNTNIGIYISLVYYEVIGNVFENPELIK